MPNIPDLACAFIDNLTLISPPPSAIWLIGSYANDRATLNSDVDLLVFGSEAFLNSLKHQIPESRDIDCFVVFNGVDFRNPWRQDRQGSLNRWEWKCESERLSTYKGTSFTKSDDEDEAYVEERIERAVLLWPI
ncbi:nucleotidyltransferase domain-containing protein [Aeromonas tecta]|uniref:nucleotidyltransferase domain-containing protein n=1 Tax=Aeromonas tecta TaxID=324617 RepID=UPI0018DDBC1C